MFFYRWTSGTITISEQIMTDIKRLIGSRIRLLRKRNQLTQEALAEALGSEIVTIGRYERGEYSPSIEQLLKISTVLNVSPMELIPSKTEIERKVIIDLRASLIEEAYRVEDPTTLKNAILILTQHNVENS